MSKKFALIYLSKLVARESEHNEIVGEFRLQCIQFVVLKSETSEGRNVHDEDHLQMMNCLQ